MGDLVVELYGQRMGVLRGKWRAFDLVSSPEATQRLGLDSQILSVAIPLAVMAPHARKGRRQAFFHGPLPFTEDLIAGRAVGEPQGMRRE